MLTRALLILALLITIATLATWLATDRAYYTKFQVVEQVEVEVEADDPLAGTGFFDEAEDGGPATEVRTETRDEFRLGLLPTPEGLFDKHMLSVLSLAGPAWALVVVSALLDWRRRRKGGAVPDESTEAADLYVQVIEDQRSEARSRTNPPALPSFTSSSSRTNDPRHGPE